MQVLQEVDAVRQVGLHALGGASRRLLLNEHLEVRARQLFNDVRRSQRSTRVKTNELKINVILGTALFICMYMRYYFVEIACNYPPPPHPTKKPHKTGV